MGNITIERTVLTASVPFALMGTSWTEDVLLLDHSVDGGGIGRPGGAVRSLPLHEAGRALG